MNKSKYVFSQLIKFLNYVCIFAALFGTGILLNYLLVYFYVIIYIFLTADSYLHTHLLYIKWRYSAIHTAVFSLKFSR